MRFNKLPLNYSTTSYMLVGPSGKGRVMILM